MNDHAIDWPAVVQHTGDMELTYIADQTEWDNDIHLHASVYDESDQLIDSTGHIYKLKQGPDNKVMLSSTGTTIRLHDLLGLVKAHAALLGACCISKLTAPSHREAIAIAGSIDDVDSCEIKNR